MVTESDPQARKRTSGRHMDVVEQRKLAAEQVEAFYHEDFVDDQVRDFGTLMPDAGTRGVVVDVGGGCGFMAKQLQDVIGVATRVIDMDPKSVSACAEIGVDAREGEVFKHP